MKKETEYTDRCVYCNCEVEAGLEYGVERVCDECAEKIYREHIKK